MKKCLIGIIAIILITIPFVIPIKGEVTKNELHEIESAIESLYEIKAVEEFIFYGCSTEYFKGDFEKYSKMNVDDVLVHIETFYTNEVKNFYIENIKNGNITHFEEKSGVLSRDYLHSLDTVKMYCESSARRYEYNSIEYDIEYVLRFSQNRYAVIINEIRVGSRGVDIVEYYCYIERQENGTWKFYSLDHIINRFLREEL